MQDKDTSERTFSRKGEMRGKVGGTLKVPEPRQQPITDRMGNTETSTFGQRTLPVM